MLGATVGRLRVSGFTGETSVEKMTLARDEAGASSMPHVRDRLGWCLRASAYRENRRRSPLTGGQCAGPPATFKVHHAAWGGVRVSTGQACAGSHRGPGGWALLFQNSSMAGPLAGLLFALLFAAKSFTPGRGSLSPRALTRSAPSNCVAGRVRLSSASGACSFQSAHAGLR